MRVIREVFLSLGVLCVCAGCASVSGTGGKEQNLASDVRGAMIRSTLPDPSGNEWPRFFSATPRVTDLDTERRACIAGAARQAAMYLEVSGLDLILGSERSGAAVTLQNTVWRYDEASAGNLAAEAEIVQEYRDAEGTNMLVRFPSIQLPAGVPDLSDLLGTDDEPPSWTVHTPVLKGYRLAVGTASRKRLFTDSIEAADRSALAALLSRSAVFVAGSGARSEAAPGTVTTSGRAHLSAGTVRGFFILDRWVSPDGGTYYSLAVCVGS
jgi:hypothetical protein